MSDDDIPLILIPYKMLLIPKFCAILIFSRYLQTGDCFLPNPLMIIIPCN